MFENLEPRQMLAVDGVTAYWALDEVTGTVATDSSTNGYDGILDSAQTWQTGDGAIAGSLQFDGSDDYVNISAAGAQISSDFAVSGWMKSTDTDSTQDIIFAINTSTGGNRLFLTLGRPIYPSLGKLFILDGSTNQYESESTILVNDGQWHHFAVSRSGNTIGLYVDGELQGQHQTSITLNANDQWSLGQEFDGTSPSDWLDGSLDEVRLYNRALTETEIDQLAHARFASGETLTVSTADDENDGNYGPGDLSLREALYLANTIPGDNRIEFDPSISEILVDSELVIDSSVEIVGLGADRLTIDGQDQTRVFHVTSGGSATLRGMTVTGGNATGKGGGLLAEEASVAIYDSTFESNTSSNQGGGLYFTNTQAATILVSGSTFSGNSSSGNRGTGVAIHSAGGTATVSRIENTTISNNTGTVAGGALYVTGNSNLTVEIVNSTIAENHSGSNGHPGGLWITAGGETKLSNTILVGNTRVSPGNLFDFYQGVGTITGGYNLFNYAAGSVASSFANGANNQELATYAAAGLLPLGDYGGPTETYALLATSPAINAGDNTAASGLDSEQRGEGYLRTLDGTVDIGAFESHVVVDVISGDVRIWGTDNADGITLYGDGVTIDSAGGQLIAVDLQNATSVVVDGLAGDDAILVDASLTNDVELRGGSGEDLLQGGAGNDLLVGGLGADVLIGGDGNDTLWGSDDTTVILDDGADTFFNDDGVDTLHVDYSAPIGNPYTPSGGDIFDKDELHVVPDSGGGAPTLTGSTWNQGLLWDGNYGFGSGWNVAGIDRLKYTGSASTALSLDWVRSDGHTVSFTRATTNDPWTAVSGDPADSEITYDSPTQTFTRIDKYGNESDYLISATGLAMVVRAVDRLGVGREYAYSDHDSDGKTVELDSVTIVRPSQVDEVTTYNYTTVSGGYERVTSIVDPFGRTTTLVYSGGKISQVKLPEVVYKAPEVNIYQRFRESGNPTTSFTYDSNGYVNYITDADNIFHSYTWQSNGELWVEDADPNPIRYLGTPTDVYSEWLDKTEAWRDFLPTFTLTDGTAGMGASEVKEGYAIDEVGRTTTLHTNRDGQVVWRQDPSGATTEVVRTAAGLVDEMTVKAPGDLRVVDNRDYDYDASHNLTQVTNFDGTTKTWQYDATFSQVTLATDELGHETAFDINSTTGNIDESRVIVGLDDRTSSETDDVVTEYGYTADGLVSQIVKLRNDIDGTPQLSFATLFGYTTVNSLTGTDHNSRRWSATAYGGDDPSVTGVYFINPSAVYVVERDDYDNPTEIVDEMGRSTFYQYDELDRLILEHTDDPGFGQLIAARELDLSLGGRIGAESFGTLLGAGSLSALSSSEPSVAAFTAGASSPITNETNYDPCGCPTVTSLDCYGNPIHNETNYNANGSPNNSTGPNGRKTSNGYGPSSSTPTRTRTLPYAGFSAALTSGNGMVNEEGEPGQSAALVASATGSTETLYLYNARKELVAMRDGAGVLTRYEYDAEGRLLRTIGGVGTTAERTYNVAGEMIASTDGEGRTTRTTYDDAGRVVSKLEPGHDFQTTYLYDSAGNLRRVYDPLGNVQETLYDERGRVIEEIDENGDSTTFTYYADNQIHTLTDANENTTTWTYDGAGRVHSETNELGHTETYYYDEFNRIAEVEDRNGRIVRYHYDGQMLKSEEWVESGSTVRDISYEYRDMSHVFRFGISGQLSQVTDTGRVYGAPVYGADDHNYQYSYDDQGRLESSELNVGGLNDSFEVLQSYDLGDRLNGVQFSLDSVVDHENTFTYDAASRLTSITQSGPEARAKHVEFAYNRAGQFSQIDRYAAATATSPVASTSFSYDTAGRLGQMAHTQGSSGNLLAGYGYSYDYADRLTGIDFLPDGVNSAYDYSGESVVYTYDDRGQINTADYSGTTGTEENYNFDANGNRVGSQVIGGVSQSYAATAGTNNQLQFDGTFTYAYDNNGNRTARFVDGNSNGVLDSGDTAITEYAWDHRNRLTTVTERATFGGAATQTVEYDYDYLNQLVSRTVDSTDRTIYAYNDGQVVLQFEGDAANPLTADELSNRYLWSPVVDQLMADEQIDWTNNEANGETLWALTDHLGTVRDLVNDAGIVQNHKSYDTFGNVTAETNAAKDAVFGFTGKLFDDATGQQNNRNRLYDAPVGGWLSEDPIGFAAGDANLGRYVDNAPTQYVDPLGLIGPVEPLPVTDPYPGSGSGRPGLYDPGRDPVYPRNWMDPEPGLGESWSPFDFLAPLGGRILGKCLTRGAGSSLHPRASQGPPTSKPPYGGVGSNPNNPVIIRYPPSNLPIQRPGIGPIVKPPFNPPDYYPPGFFNPN